MTDFRTDASYRVCNGLENAQMGAEHKMRPVATGGARQRARTYTAPWAGRPIGLESKFDIHGHFCGGNEARVRGNMRSDG